MAVGTFVPLPRSCSSGLEPKTVTSRREERCFGTQAVTGEDDVLYFGGSSEGDQETDFATSSGLMENDDDRDRDENECDDGDVGGSRGVLSAVRSRSKRESKPSQQAVDSRRYQQYLNLQYPSRQEVSSGDESS